MNHLHQTHDSISTVQLSPFGEEQWNRIITYSPIYVHWTDMLMMSQKRTNKPTSGKLNLIDKIDLNTLKLEDEILLNELHHMRRAAAIPSQEKNTNHESKVFDYEQDQQITPSTDDHQTSSNSFQESKDLMKHNCSYVELSFTHQLYNIKRSVLTNQTMPPQVNGNSQVKQLPQFSLGPKPQPSLGVQLRQSAIAREHVLSATHDRGSPTPVSFSSSKRSASSAFSNPRHQQQEQQQQQQFRTFQSSLPNKTNSTNNIQEQLTSESSSISMRRARARSTTGTRSTMNMVKTKNDRTRQKQNIELKTLLVKPWKQALHSEGILDETIPNSLEIMYKMCGPSTPFERNLRSTFQRQLNQFRNGSMNS